MLKKIKKNLLYSTLFLSILLANGCHPSKRIHKKMIKEKNLKVEPLQRFESQKRYSQKEHTKNPKPTYPWDT